MTTISTLGSFEPQDYIDEAQILLNILLKAPALAPKMQEENRHGGYLCIANTIGMPLTIAPIGLLSNGTYERYLKNAPEKAIRLGRNPEHVLSRQSRNEQLQQFSGAVRGSQRLYSFSGLPEAVDELFMLALAEKMGDLEPEEVDAILTEFPNETAQLVGCFWR